MRLLRLLFPLVALSVVLAACGGDARRQPMEAGAPQGTPVSLQADPERSDWVLLVRADGPRWLGPNLWQGSQFSEDELGPDVIRLTRAGEQVPFLWISTPEGPGLLFYGETSETDAGRAGSYHLTIGAEGLEMSQPSSDAVDATTCQESTLSRSRYEQDAAYRSTAPFASPWFWTSLRPPESFTVTVPLTNTLAQPVRLDISVWGQSRMPQDPDHHLRLSWNGEVIEEHFWDGNEAEMWTLEVPAEHIDLAAPAQLLALAAPGGTDAPVELNWLDYVEVTWRRELVISDGDWRSWSADTAGQACWRLDSDGEVASNLLEMTPLLVAILVDQDGHAEVVDATQDAEGRQLLVAQSQGDVGWIGLPWLAPPPDVVRSRDEYAVDELLGVDYLIVAPEAFHEALAPLLVQRQGEGLDAQILTPEAVYDTFGEGIPGAASIREMVEHLAGEGQLRYVLLAGDGSADPRAVWERDALTLPTAWVRTHYVGHTASDAALVAGEAGEPLVALGRLPAASVEEIEMMVDKTLAWSPTSRLMLMSDDEPEFANLVDLIGDVQEADLVLDAGTADARRKALDWLEEAPGMMVYVGHGSLPLLGDEKILTMEDAGGWEGPTVVAAWSCLCANFSHPAYSGLAETWLRAPDGVAAFVGPTGETTTSQQLDMALSLQRALAEGEALGDALVSAWETSTSEDARASFLLLGDPALRAMPGPAGD